mmetsp:Transcript_12246/g.31049  ORF Transcript_12246/g.31049 Transcript_12246/m.31049 type:complete len:328 (-) Transcript_12246:81-1064(-)|eukprot:CAMPEP_0177651326 /NCGR_PEP_ID=MMETSP0447-20121125/12481_1 /TAXON_ID=0 /ORGANISM="Stygamoeba regulata, Strain BSH-02190019" /LENGTH=327 /DNA_ID=CAMNT_0019154385 /DNA_START=226 /DNA_END=1209 /DNA_ORIENTATION=-
MIMTRNHIASFPLMVGLFLVLVVLTGFSYGTLVESSPDTQSYIPVVLWHGMGDSCCNPLSMGRIKRMIEKHLPGIYVHSLEIGENVLRDMENGFLLESNKQVQWAMNQTQSIPQLAKGFSIMGFSQGGQFSRALLQRQSTPSIYNLISVGGQHQGVFGFPDCPAPSIPNCEELRDALTTAAYTDLIQAHVAQSNYWHDPTDEAGYRAKCNFLPDINNDGSLNQSYRENLQSVNKFVMVKFLNDTIVIPRESEWFGFYAPGQDTTTQTLQESTLYQEDWLGLKEMDQRDQLVFLSTEGEHLQFTDQWFLDNLLPYLNVTTEQWPRTRA